MRRREDINFDRQLRGLSGKSLPAEKMPIVHITAAWPAKEILRLGKLTTRNCRIFKRPLVYFFVLKPAYRSKIGNEESHQLSRFPVAFVLDNSSVPQPLHAYPFDTGGAADGAFDSQADPYIPLEDYGLDPSFDAVGRFISWFYGDVERYFKSTLRPGLNSEVQPFQSVAVSYIDIARMGVEGSNDHDTRASTIEISSSHNVDLRGNAKLVVAPKQYIEGNLSLINNINELKKSGCDLKLYDWQPNRTPNDYQSDIFRIIELWYRKKRIL